MIIGKSTVLSDLFDNVTVNYFDLKAALDGSAPLYIPCLLCPFANTFSLDPLTDSFHTPI